MGLLGALFIGILLIVLLTIWITLEPGRGQSSCVHAALGQAGLGCYPSQKEVSVHTETGLQWQGSAKTSAVTRHLFLTNGRFEPTVTRLLTRILKPGDLYIDIGAKEGYFARVAEQHIQTPGHVICFETGKHKLDVLNNQPTSSFVQQQRQSRPLYRLPSSGSSSNNKAQEEGDDYDDDDEKREQKEEEDAEHEEEEQDTNNDGADAQSPPPAPGIRVFQFMPQRVRKSAHQQTTQPSSSSSRLSDRISNDSYQEPLPCHEALPLLERNWEYLPKWVRNWKSLRPTITHVTAGQLDHIIPDVDRLLETSATILIRVDLQDREWDAIHAMQLFWKRPLQVDWLFKMVPAKNRPLIQLILNWNSSLPTNNHYQPFMSTAGEHHRLVPWEPLRHNCSSMKYVWFCGNSARARHAAAASGAAGSKPTTTTKKRTPRRNKTNQ